MKYSLDCKIKEIKDMSIYNGEFGDAKLNVFPVVNNSKWVSLPNAFKEWEEDVNNILSHVPVDERYNNHYVTIDSKFFTKSESLRREGIHIDGNFCADPKFEGVYCWGGSGDSGEGWAGVKYDHELKKGVSDFAIPYDLEIPVGTYVSGSKGGILSVSSYGGCVAWDGHHDAKVEAGGALPSLEGKLNRNNGFMLESGKLYFMTSNTPHESLIIPQGKRRTLIRVTLDVNYPNENILSNSIMTA